MIYSIIAHDEEEQLCCVDKIGRRAFLLREFFNKDLTELCIDSNQIDEIPGSMDQFITMFDILWADDMALYFGGRPELGVSLDPEKGWFPLVRLEELWSPQDDTRGPSLLEE